MLNIYNPLALTNEQKLVYIKLLIYLAKSDNNPDYLEKQFIKNIITRFNLDQALLQNLSIPQSIDDLFNVLKPIRDRKIALDLVHCIRFAAAIDSTIAEEESKIIRNVARLLNIDEDSLLVINNFVFDELTFLQQACDALEADEVRC